MYLLYKLLEKKNTVLGFEWVIESGQKLLAISSDIIDDMSLDFKEFRNELSDGTYLLVAFYDTLKECKEHILLDYKFNEKEEE